ncbi:unnamed protein product [Pleuronectes platessa]|uniref:Uncharacterized protein n=1 Tax=Pleuronectes platessa TaxID=8262 RepID=A0A9N7TY67_PLEPL|nr:unnamed protein product [Pleuronectes platessa]
MQSADIGFLQMNPATPSSPLSSHSPRGPDSSLPTPHPELLQPPHFISALSLHQGRNHQPESHSQKQTNSANFTEHCHSERERGEEMPEIEAQSHGPMDLKEKPKREMWRQGQ